MSEETAAPVASAAVPASATVTKTERFAFTGDGGEYFRIWVVNAVLSIATIGIYSAWAKVRKSSYFARNTRLAGDTFEFVAEPLAILRGRVLALVLIGLYTYSFEFSLTLGLATTMILVAVAPLLFASATRFRLRNTRWRGMRFDFTATRAEAYRAITLVVAIWISAGVAASVGGEPAVPWLAGATALLLPWMHHRIKAFQHRHASVAGARSTFAPALGRFYAVYATTALVLVLAGLGASAIAGAATVAFSGAAAAPAWALSGLVFLAVPALIWLAAWPFFATRIQRVVWERTSLGPFGFETSIAYGGLLPIAAKNLLLLIVTAGLYWPFASIAWARYRIECMRLVGTQDLAAVAAAASTQGSRATFGEGAVDFFGVDLGW